LNIFVLFISNHAKEQAIGNTYLLIILDKGV